MAPSDLEDHSATKFSATSDISRQLERDALDDILGDMEAQHGRVDEDEVAVIMARLVS